MPDSKHASIRTLATCLLAAFAAPAATAGETPAAIDAPTFALAAPF